MAISFLHAAVILNLFDSKSYGQSAMRSLTGVNGGGLNDLSARERKPEPA
jgi:hypothetical protein